MPPAEETVFTPDSEMTVVELDPPGDVVDVEELPGIVVDDVEEVELVDGSRLVDDDDDEVLDVDVVALTMGAPGSSLT